MQQRKLWLVALGMTSLAQVPDQASFRGSIGGTATNDYVLSSTGQMVDPTNGALSYGIGMGYRMSSGFVVELDFISSSNKYNTTTLNNACSGASSPCVYTACVNDTSVNPATTTCTGTNMAAPATTTGSTVTGTGTTTTAGSPTATQISTTSSSSTSGTVTTTTVTTVTEYTGTSSSVTDATSGYMAASSLMLNLLYQFSPSTKFNPYIGYGVGGNNASAGIGVTTTPTNTTVDTTTISTTTTDSSTGSTTTTTAPSSTIYVSSQQADQTVQTLTASVGKSAYQFVLGAEYRFDIHNTLDFRFVKRYITVPNVTQLIPDGTPVPSIGVTTTTNGVVTTTVSNIPACTMTFEIGLLYYS